MQYTIVIDGVTPLSAAAQSVNSQVAPQSTTTTVPEAQSKNPILPSVPELVWGSLSFIVVFVLLAKFGFKPVKAMMDARTERIRETVESAEKARTDAQGVLDEYQRQLADAKNEANRIIDEARQTAEALRKDLVAKAEADAAAVRARGSADVEAAKERAMAELKGQLTQLSIELAERVVKRNLDQASNAAMVDEYISSIGAGNK